MGLRYLELAHSGRGEDSGGLGAVQEQEIHSHETKDKATWHTLGLTDLHSL
jgi:hypothetical protein